MSSDHQGKDKTVAGNVCIKPVGEGMLELEHQVQATCCMSRCAEAVTLQMQLQLR